MPHVGPNAARVRTVLIKLGHLRHAPLDRLPRDGQSVCRKPIAQEIESPRDAPNECLVRMLPHAQLRHDL
ncbi:MAG: hypothetical protein OEV77_10730, partial [Nitrospira sp.]|nr:hypothetical protein [Nitrospira sp.]